MPATLLDLVLWLAGSAGIGLLVGWLGRDARVRRQRTEIAGLRQKAIRLEQLEQILAERNGELAALRTEVGDLRSERAERRIPSAAIEGRTSADATDSVSAASRSNAIAEPEAPQAEVTDRPPAAAPQPTARVVVDSPTPSRRKGRKKHSEAG